MCVLWQCWPAMAHSAEAQVWFMFGNNWHGNPAYLTQFSWRCLRVWEQDGYFPELLEGLANSFPEQLREGCRLEQCWYWGDSEMLLNNSFSPFLNCSRRREQHGLGRQHRRLSTYCTGQSSSPQHPTKGQVGVTLCLEF